MLLFVVWVVFFDKYNLINRLEMRKQLNELERERQFYVNEIQKDKQIVKDLQENPAKAERYGREAYLMKKDNEDIFLIVNEDENK